MTKVAIVGSRDWSNSQMVTDYVWQLPEWTTVISGGARGVDTFAQDAAVERIAQRGEPNWDVEIFPALWDVYGKSAGYRRNADIVAAADRIVAFWDGKSRGTAHTIRLAQQANKPVEIHYPDERVEVRGIT